MTKAEIARSISWKTELSIPECIKMVDCILEVISDTVAKGDRVDIRKFGSFYSRKKAKRMGRNPKTGKSVIITARTIPCFKVSKEFKEMVNK
tara:strand:- start:154 stop:429 length:276 start_codon:yes stop_codon:yes gene_type:complete